MQVARQMDGTAASTTKRSQLQSTLPTFAACCPRRRHEPCLVHSHGAGGRGQPVRQSQSERPMLNDRSRRRSHGGIGGDVDKVARAVVVAVALRRGDDRRGHLTDESPGGGSGLDSAAAVDSGRDGAVANLPPAQDIASTNTSWSATHLNCAARPTVGQRQETRAAPPQHFRERRGAVEIHEWTRLRVHLTCTGCRPSCLRADHPAGPLLPLSIRASCVLVTSPCSTAPGARLTVASCFHTLVSPIRRPAALRAGTVHAARRTAVRNRVGGRGSGCSGRCAGC